MAGIVVGNPRNMCVGLRVLVVDDDPLALLIAKRMLTTQQYHVTTAFGGREALSLLKDTKGKFDLVLCDLYMPGVDGFHLLRIARAVYNIPFVFMSSDHKLDVMERGVKAGARFFFPKPLTMINYENMWQFVYIENIEYFQGINIEDRGPPPPPPHDRSSSLSLSNSIHRQGRNSSSSSNNSNGKKRRQDVHHDNNKKKRPYKKHEKEDHDFGKKIAVVFPKKRRVIWTSELHERFLHALSILSRARAVPKRILALMKVKEVNRANIASHLQKYRLYQNKYKGTVGSDCPRRRIRMRLPIETKYHDYSPSNDHSMLSDYSPSRPQSPLLENQPGLQDNFSPPNKFNQVPSACPQYHFKEGSNDSFMAQASYDNPAAVTNPGYLERPWMSGARTMNQSNVDTYPSLFGTSAPLYGNDVNNDSTTNATPIMAGQQINQGMHNESLDPNFDNLSFESLQNSPPSTDIENMGALSAWNGVLAGTIDGDISNTNNSVDNNTMDEIRKGKKPVGEAEDDFSLVYDFFDFNGMNSNMTSLSEPFVVNGMNSNMTSLSEPFVVNPNYVVVGESSTSALVNPNNLQQGNEVNNSGWFNSVDDIANYFLNQGPENAMKVQEEGGGYVNPDFNHLWFLQDGGSNP